MRLRRDMILLVLLCGCDAVSVTRKDDGGDDSGETDTDTDADGDADGDADTDTDTDTEGLCDESFPTTAPAGPDCVTASLGCEDTVEATTDGGASEFVGETWETFFCTPNLDQLPYDGPERVYAIDIPKDTTATFSLDTPCDDLDLFVLYWQDDDSCPGDSSSIRECEGSYDEGTTDTLSVWSDVGAQYLVAVDAKDGGSANFRLSVTCQ